MDPSCHGEKQDVGAHTLKIADIMILPSTVI